METRKRLIIRGFFEENSLEGTIILAIVGT